MNEETEDFEEVDSYEYGSSTSITVGVIVITLLIYFVYILRWKPAAAKKGSTDRVLLLRASKTSKSRSQESQQYTACESPECVRCQKYEIVKAEAQEKLKEFIELSSDSGLDRVTASLDDLRSLPASELQKPNVLYVPGLRGQPFWSSSDEFLHVTNLFERQWGFIAQEFESAYGHTNAGWFRNNTKTGAWSVFYFYNQGERMNGNCKKCPRTAALIDSLSSFMKLNIFGNALFSVLESGTAVSEHCGPCNVRIRCHLGLVVPDKTSITVGGQTRSYNLGCCVYFDDSFVHSSVNIGTNSGEPRAVLLLDLWHPDLTMKERDALNFVFPASGAH